MNNSFKCACCEEIIVVIESEDKYVQHLKKYNCTKCGSFYCFKCMHRTGARTIEKTIHCKLCFAELNGENSQIKFNKEDCCLKRKNRALKIYYSKNL